jgi:hypothetical protein
MSCQIKKERRKASNYQHEALYAFRNIFGEFGGCDGTRRAAEILCWDLSTPLPITWPLRKKCETMKKEKLEQY